MTQAYTCQNQYTQYKTENRQNPHPTNYTSQYNLYLPPRDAASPHYATLETGRINYIQLITDKHDFMLTGDVNSHLTLLCSHTWRNTDLRTSSAPLIRKHTSQSTHLHNTFMKEITPLITQHINNTIVTCFNQKIPPAHASTKNTTGTHNHDSTSQKQGIWNCEYTYTH